SLPRPPQAVLISAVGTIGTVTPSPFFPERSQPRHRPELAGNWRKPPVSSRNFISFVSPPNHSSKVEEFGFGQNTGETLPNFRQESKENFKSNCSRKGKIVICARQLPGVGHAQGLVQILKWNWDRILSMTL
ncbi:hypothetical protein Prudu_003758, partial [Prunus dulcis]